jgi:hypothetical protein
LVADLLNELELVDPVKLGGGIFRPDEGTDLERLLRRIERDVLELSDHIAERFFSHSSATRVGGAGRRGS